MSTRSLRWVKIIGIRIRSPQDGDKQVSWLAADQLCAERILIVPAFLRSATHPAQHALLTMIWMI